jgi:hypothetical protein
MRRRRGRAEIEQIVAEFTSSGLTRTEFCRRYGMSKLMFFDGSGLWMCAKRLEATPEFDPVVLG